MSNELSPATAAERDPRRHLVELDRVEALRLLAGVPFGRVVFTQGALPAIRPVNHLLDREEIIIRTRLATALNTIASIRSPDMVVAYEADEIDATARLGWSVVVTGVARPITDPRRIAAYEQALRPWVTMTMDTVIGIRADIVSGFRLADPDHRRPG